MDFAALRGATEPPFPAVQLANTFIERFGSDNESSHLKLQKLVYFAYGWWLALLPHRPRLADARPQVWKFGPVFQPIYAAFASHRGDPIRQMARLGPFGEAASIERSDVDHSQVIDWIWSRYGGFTAGHLSDLTHQPDSPWFQKAKENNFFVPRYLELSDDEVRAYFRKMGVAEGFIAQPSASPQEQQLAS